MEIRCENGRFPIFERILNTVVTCEGTAELTVPDAMPDVSELLLTDGQSLIRSKDVHTGGVTVTGISELTVLYRTEEGGTERLTADVPFDADAACGTGAESRAVASVRLVSAESRLLSARRILVRAEVCVTVSLWIPSELCWMKNAATEGCSVELRREMIRLVPVAAVEEKTFTVDDVQPLPAGKPPVRAILYAKAALRAEGSEPVGGKLVVRGNAAVSVIYQTAGGEIAQAELNQPWSAFPELPDHGEERGFETVAALTGCSVEADDGGFRVSVGGVVQVVIRCAAELELITDAYGTDCSLIPAVETAVVEAEAEQETAADTVSVRLESLRKPRALVSLTADCGRPREEKDSVRVPITVKALCIMEDGRPEQLTGRGEAVCSCIGSVPEVSCGELYASVASQGADVRVPVGFAMTRIRKEELHYLVSAEVKELPAGEGKPTVTILRVSSGDSVWSLGKARSLPCASIRAYNRLSEDEEPAPGSLLLLAR